jgi:hypothetical protein
VTDLFGTRPDQSSAHQVCHELLLRLAGRLPDELLWRLRDWLAAGNRTALGVTLPRELLRHRIGLTEPECELLAAAVGEWGASRRMLDAVLPVDTADEPVADFRSTGMSIDPAALSVLAVVRGHPGCRELHQTVRHTLAATGARAGRRDQRVVLVRGADRPWVLAGTLQRLLRAHGDRTPCVEVLSANGEPTEYHRSAIINSMELWRAPSAVAVGA